MAKSQEKMQFFKKSAENGRENGHERNWEKSIDARGQIWR